MRNIGGWVGGAIGFAIFQVAGNDFFPTAAGGMFNYTWERAIAVLIAGFAGMAIGRLLGGLLEGVSGNRD